MNISSFVHKTGLTCGGKCVTVLLSALLVSVIPQTAVHADNWIVTERPTSDPAPMVFTYNGETRVYVYCTQDKLTGFGSAVYPIDTIHIYSSDDMFHWRDEGVALDEQSCQSWVNKGAHQLWAPTVVYYKGKYRLFVSAVDRNGATPNDASARVFTATADSPKGPFIASNNPLYLSNISIGSIDPFCYIDTMPDGKTAAILAVRMGAGATSVHMAQLNDDATDVVGQPWVVRTLPTDGYKEGTWIFKRNGFYYLIYATERGGVRKETIEYATAPVPAQGTITSNTQWTYRGVILKTNSSEFTIHSGACHYKPKGESEAKWYIFWQGVQEPEIGGLRLFRNGVGRCVGIEYVNFTNANPPLIQETAKTSRGVGICRASIDSIQVDRYSSSSNCAVRCIQHPGLATAPNGWVVSDIKNNGTCTYKNVDFTPSEGKQFATVAANISSSNANGSIEIRTGSNSGTLLATIPVPNTGDLNTYKTTDYVKLTAVPKEGVQDLALVFKTSAANTFQVNWIKFGEETSTVIKTYGAVLDQSGFNFRRVSKNTFKIFCKENVAAAIISAINLQGREIAGAVTVRPFAWNCIMVDLNENRLSSGAYLLTIKNPGGEVNIPFIY
ncbi:MAG: family 43 glycosylhydrolase [Chitinispirillaceae bacterium]|nr:family 43 glycosylhydrolase [Chitinispirillaceae bacterium]